jgi:hypothetical protein
MNWKHPGVVSLGKDRMRGQEKNLAAKEKNVIRVGPGKSAVHGHNFTCLERRDLYVGAPYRRVRPDYFDRIMPTAENGTQSID